jgi:glycosyltransferase involved in cell wall biosynthesis
MFGLADHFIVHSERNRAALLSSYPAARGRVSVLPHGLLSVSYEPPAAAEARAKLGVGSATGVVLAFGNIRPYKGLATLLPAFRRVLDRGQEALLVVAGQPWGAFEEYERIIDNLGLRPHMRTELEFLSDERIAELFAAADVAVFPYSKFDGQSGAAALALSFGKALVVSDVGGLPEFVDNESAIVPANDAGALAASLSAVLSSPELRGRLEAGSKRRARELDWRTIAEGTVRVYRDVLAQRLAAA